MLKLKSKSYLSFVGLLALLLLIFWDTEKETSDFAFDQQNKVNRIVINNSLQEISLQKKGEQWFIGESEVFPSKMEELFYVLKNLEIKSHPLSSEKDSLVLAMEQATHVRLYEGEEVLYHLLYLPEKKSAEVYAKLLAPDVVNIRRIQVLANDQYFTDLLSTAPHHYSRNSLITVPFSAIQSIQVKHNDQVWRLELKEDEAAYFYQNHLKKTLTMDNAYLSMALKSLQQLSGFKQNLESSNLKSFYPKPK